MKQRKANLEGKEVLIHYSLTNGKWSCKDLELNRVTLWADSLIVKVTGIKISLAGRKRTLEKKQRNVHAYIKAIIIEQDLSENDLAKRGFLKNGKINCLDHQRLVSYNPYKSDKFYYVGPDMGMGAFQVRGQIIVMTPNSHQMIEIC